MKIASHFIIASESLRLSQMATEHPRDSARRPPALIRRRSTAIGDMVHRWEILAIPCDIGSGGVRKPSLIRRDKNADNSISLSDSYHISHFVYFSLNNEQHSLGLQGDLNR